MDRKKIKTLIVIAGPTASGKTALSIELAKTFGTEIISADSRQFYREISIGTAKPSKEELSEATHHFINSHSIHDEYNVGKYEADAIALIEKQFLKKDILILTGGSGLYINAVCNGFDELPVADPEIRKGLLKTLEDKGLEALLHQLKEKDPDYFQKVDQKNPHRVMRALEVCIASGKTYSSQRKNIKKERSFNIIKIGLELSREELYNRINKRMDNMIASGLVDEAKKMIPFRQLNPLQTVGYKELFDHFDGIYDLPKAIELIKQNTRRFAKRQLTWFSGDPDIRWVKPDEVLNNVTLLMKR